MDIIFLCSFLLFLYYVLFVLILFTVSVFFFFFKQKTAYDMRISDWSSDVCSSDLLDIAGAFLLLVARLVPLRPPVAYYVTVLTIGPLLGSFITEPAAMTLSALLLRARYFSQQAPQAFKYATLGVLLVNISIGGTARTSTRLNSRH